MTEDKEISLASVDKGRGRSEEDKRSKIKQIKQDAIESDFSFLLIVWSVWGKFYFVSWF